MSFYQRWRQGIRDITAPQKLHAKMVGHLWAAIGLLISLVVMLYRGLWYVTIFLLAMIWLQFWDYLSTKQSYYGALELEKEYLEEKVKEII